MKRTPLQAADLKLSRRLLMVALTGTLPLFVVALLLLTWSYRGKIDFILQERRGIAFELPLEQLLEAVPHYQAAARRSLAGDGSAARERADLARQIDALVATISTNYNGDPGQTLGFTDAKLALRNRDAARLSVLLDAWTQLRGAPPAGSALDRAASQLIESVRTMIVHDGDLSNLILDDNLDSYYLMHLTLCALPPAQQRLGEITLQVGGWLRDGLAGANQAQVTLQAELIQQVDQKVIVDDTQTALIEHGSRPTAGPTMEQNMRPALAAYTTANGRFLALLDRVAAGDAVPAADLEAAGWTTRAASFQLGQVGADELDRLLAGRLWSIQAQRLRSDCLLGLTLLAAAGVMGWIIRGLLQTRYAEMRRTEEELRNSAEKFLKAFQANPSGIAITEMETGRYLDVNESFGRLYGHTREEMVGHTSLEMGIWGRSNERDRLIHRLLADGRVRDLEMHTHTRHGSPRTVMVNAELIELDGRRCVVSLIHDITERKCAEDALRASENRFKEVERAVNDGIWERNLGTRTAYISPRWKAILGYTDAELPNPDAAFFDHIHPDDRDAVDEAIRCHLEEKTRFVIEFRLRHKDGSHRWVRSRGEAIRDASGRPLRMVGAITDITDDKRAAEALLASEKQYRQLVESSLEAITVHRDWTIVYVNPAAARMFGANAMPQLVGKPILDLVHREFHALARMRHASVLAQGSGGPMVEMRLLRLDGTEIEVEVQSVRVLFEGEAATQITARDVTQRKQAQKNASQLAALVAFSDDAIIGKDLNGIITSWNQGAEKIYGYTAGEMVGAAGTRLIPAARMCAQP